MNSFLVQNNQHSIKVEGSHGLYKMEMNFHFADLKDFSDRVQSEFYVLELHNDYSKRSSEIYFRRREADERPIMEVMQTVIEETMPN